MPSKGSRSEYSGQSKRYALVRVYEILKEYTDEDHHMKQSELVDKLCELYDLNVNRKLIAEKIEDINYLGKDYGLEVSSEKGSGTYLLGRMFEKSEIRFLIDAVFSSRSIGQKQALEITNKLQKFLSKYERKSFKYVAKSGEITRTDSKSVLYNIDTLLTAIEGGKKISFNYNREYLDQEKNEKKKNQIKTASPYYLVNNQGKYYLVCNIDWFNDITNLRVERMSNIVILDEDVRDVKTIPGLEKGLDISKYANANIYMFATDTINANIRIDSDYSVAYVLDWFGDNARVYKGDDGRIYARITASEWALIYWCLQYGETIELLEPHTTREKIKEIVDKMHNNYKD